MKPDQIISVTIDSDGEEKLKNLVGRINIEQQKIDTENIGVLTTALKDYAYGDIRKALEIDMIMGVPILCTCFIEQMATFRYGKEIGVNEFSVFVNNYLPMYDAKSLRNDLRNKLVHNYSVGETYTIIKGHKQYHLKTTKGDQKIILNIESFVDDIGSALDKFLQELETDKAIRSTALTALAKFPVVYFIPGN